MSLATAIADQSAAVLNAPIEQRALTIVEKAKTISSITTIEQRTEIFAMGSTLKALDEEAAAWFKPIKDAAHKAHAEICKKEKSVREPIQEAKSQLSRLIGSFDQQMEKARLAEEARVNEANRLAAVAEAKRISDEQALNDAIELEAQGDLEGAKAVLANPVPVPVNVAPVVLPTAVPKSANGTTAKRWLFEITDPSLIPDQYKVIDEKAIGAVVRALKDKTNIPGVRAYPEAAARFN